MESSSGRKSRLMVCLIVVSIAGPGMLMTVDHALKENRFTRWIVRLLRWPSGQADEHYRLAERYYQAHDFEKSELECEKALRLDPTHRPAKALSMETHFILGKGKATPSSEGYDKYMTGCVLKHQNVLLEVDNAMARARRAYDRGEFESAEREARKCLEFLKWMPTGVEAKLRSEEAAALLRVILDARDGCP